MGSRVSSRFGGWDKTSNRGGKLAEEGLWDPWEMGQC